jgi:hypothetical protein
LGICSVGAQVDDLIFGIEGAIGIGEGYAAEGGEDEVGWVVDEVFGSSLPQHIICRLS